MTLRDEIKVDIYSGELDDLFDAVEWNGKAVVAMVEASSTVEGMDSLGGPMLSGEKQFKFRRDDLRKVTRNLGMIGDLIEYAGKTYDVTEIDDRPDHPLIVVTATLRP